MHVFTPERVGTSRKQSGGLFLVPSGTEAVLQAGQFCIAKLRKSLAAYYPLCSIITGLPEFFLVLSGFYLNGIERHLFVFLKVHFADGRVLQFVDKEEVCRLLILGKILFALCL